MDCLPQLHVAALHDVAGYRGDTSGLGVLCRRPMLLGPEWMAGAGRFRNSVAGYSNYVSMGYQPWTVQGVRLGGFAGIINGYPYRSGGYFPYAGTMASVPFSFGEFHLVGLPMTPHSPSTLELSVSIRF